MLDMALISFSVIQFVLHCIYKLALFTHLNIQAKNFCFVFYLGFRPVKIIPLILIEPNQSLGGVKMGDPCEKTPDHPQAELDLSHMWPELGSNPQPWDDERFRALKISHLNYSATVAASSQELIFF